MVTERPMPLTRNAAGAIDDSDINRINFSMTNPATGFLVFCTVSSQTLRDMSVDGNYADLTSVFKAHRDTIEQSASRKFDELGADGSRKIVINNSD
jgi:hypothetical protein